MNVGKIEQLTHNHQPDFKRANCLVLRDCHDCGAKPGQPHRPGCDTEQCSVCGGQRLQCRCKAHDSAFARWTGIWPGLAESAALGIDLNEFHRRGLHRVFFVKPNASVTGAGTASRARGVGQEVDR
jgi:hypothetical protein